MYPAPPNQVKVGLAAIPEPSRPHASEGDDRITTVSFFTVLSSGEAWGRLLPQGGQDPRRKAFAPSRRLHAIRTNTQREAGDFADIVELVRSNLGSISKDELHSLCTKYAPEGIWERLEAALWKTP